MSVCIYIYIYTHSKGAHTGIIYIYINIQRGPKPYKPRDGRDSLRFFNIIINIIHFIISYTHSFIPYSINDSAIYSAIKNIIILLYIIRFELYVAGQPAAARATAIIVPIIIYNNIYSVGILHVIMVYTIGFLLDIVSLFIEIVHR